MNSDLYRGGMALVTGASGGVGRAVALRLAALNLHVCLVARDLAKMDETRRRIEAGGGTAECHVADLRHPGAIAALVDTLDNEPGPLQVMVNAAGVLHHSAIASGRQDEWAEMIQVNLIAVLESCHAAIQAMRQHQRPSHIINVGSLAGRQETGGVYGATKAAVDRIGASLRKELEEDNIRICTLIPGTLETNLGRNLSTDQMQALVAALDAQGHKAGQDRSAVVGTPEDIARAVQYVIEQPIELNIHELVLRPARHASDP